MLNPGSQHERLLTRLAWLNLRSCTRTQKTKTDMRKTAPENAMVLGNFVQFQGTSYCNRKSWLAPSNIGVSYGFLSYSLQNNPTIHAKIHQSPWPRNESLAQGFQCIPGDRMGTDWDRSCGKTPTRVSMVAVGDDKIIYTMGVFMVKNVFHY